MSSASKVAPNSKEAEMMVLGCMLSQPDHLKIAAEDLDDSDFYFTQHKTIFQVLKAAHKRELSTDTFLAGEELKKQNKLVDVGGAAYLVSLVQYAGTSAYIEEYVSELKEHSSRRQLADAANEAVRDAIEGRESTNRILEKLNKQTKSIENRTKSKYKLAVRSLKQIDAEYLLKTPQPKQMLLEYSDGSQMQQFLPRGIVGMLVGAGGVGKSHLLTQLAMSVATGTPWLGKYIPTLNFGEQKCGNVFLGFGENDDADIRRVLYKASKQIRQHDPNLIQNDPLQLAMQHIFPLSFCGHQASFLERREPSQYYQGLKMRLIDAAPANGWALIILDPVSRLLGADAEVDNAAATQFIALLEQLTQELPGNPTVLFAHHVNKAALTNENQTQSAARGSSALTDGVRWQLNLWKDKERIILTMTKSNFVKIASPITLKQDSEGLLEIDELKSNSQILTLTGGY